jgi:hypothetical protein
MVFLSFSGKPTPFTSKGTWACMICSLYAHSPALSQGPTTSRVCEAFAPAEKKNAGWLTRNCNSTMRNALKLKNLDHLHHLNDFVSKTTPIALPILGPKKTARSLCVAPSWRFCNRDFNLVRMNLLGALRSWKQMKKDELCTRYSEMSDNTLKKYLSLFQVKGAATSSFPNLSKTTCSCTKRPLCFQNLLFSSSAFFVFLAQLQKLLGASCWEKSCHAHQPHTLDTSKVQWYPGLGMT